MKETIYKCNVCEEPESGCKLIGLKFDRTNNPVLEELDKEAADVHICEICLSSICAFYEG